MADQGNTEFNFSGVSAGAESSRKSAEKSSPASNAPLAARMRPATLAEYCGQTHLLAEGSALRRALQQGRLHSMVFWGPPGVGKTTLAKLLAADSEAEFVTLSAVAAGVKDIRDIVAAARQRQAVQRRTVLFVDEVHRFNKSQQDVLLPHIEEGLFVFIGATTENPSFELNNALLSRLQVYTLQPLSSQELQGILSRALSDSERGLAGSGVTVGEAMLVALADSAGGDARAALGLLEMAVQLAQASDRSAVDKSLLVELLRQRPACFDNKGDQFYEQISALHKAVRGSSPDGALYWLARMLSGGCDPLYIARRLLRMASEDIGIADPRALGVALDGWDVQSRLGSPEGELALAQVVVYLAVAPKSNAVYTAFAEARAAAQQSPNESVPLHLRNAPTELMRSMGYAEDYRYAHDYEGGYAAGECYLPEKLSGEIFYRPVDRGLERRVREKLDHWRALDRDSEFSRYPDARS